MEFTVIICKSNILPQLLYYQRASHVCLFKLAGHILIGDRSETRNDRAKICLWPAMSATVMASVSLQKSLLPLKKCCVNFRAYEQNLLCEQVTIKKK